MMDQFVSVDALLNQEAETREHAVEGVGKVLIKGLTREEAHQISETKGTKEREIKIVSWGLVQPQMNYQQVQAWFKQPGTAGQIQNLVLAINRLSGLTEDMEERVVERFREESE